MDFLTAAQKLISIDSSPASGTVEVVEFLRGLAESMGFQVKVSEEIQNGLSQANILVRPNDKPQRLLLQTHLDTVDPGPHALWTKTSLNPYQPSIHGDRLYGLGAAEVKLDFLCKLYALQQTKDSGLSQSAVLLGTFGEEDRMRGAVKAIRERGLQAKWALIGEPTDLDIVYAGRGIAHMEITLPFIPQPMDEEVTSSTQSKIFQGRPSHSSNPEQGENAVEKLLDYLEKLPDTLHLINVDGGTSFNTIPTQAALEFDLHTQVRDDRPRRLRQIFKKIKSFTKEFQQYPSPDFDPPYPTINIGMIRTFEDHLKLSGVVRWDSHIPEGQYQSWMQDLAEVCRAQQAEFRILDAKRPFLTPKDSDFAQLCMEMAQKYKSNAQFKTQPVTNEANVFSRFGFQCLVFGPGQRLNNTHTPHEHVLISDLQKAQEFYSNVIQKVCL